MSSVMLAMVSPILSKLCLRALASYTIFGALELSNGAMIWQKFPRDISSRKLSEIATTYSFFALFER